MKPNESEARNAELEQQLAQQVETLKAHEDKIMLHEVRSMP